MIIFKKANILINNDLKEIDYGKVENLTYIELKKNYPDIIRKWSRSGFIGSNVNSLGNGRQPLGMEDNKPYGHFLVVVSKSEFWK